MNREMLMLVEAISREKNVERDVVLGAVESALAQATKKLYSGRGGHPRGGRPRQRQLRDLPPLAGGARRGRPATARCRRAAVGRARADRRHRGDEYIEEPVESVPIGRIGAMAAKQVILQKIRDAEREMLLNDFMSRGDKIFVGTVKRMDKGDIIVESGRVEGRLRRGEMIPKENLRTGDRVRAMIMEVDLTLRGAPDHPVALGP
jgi:N utilization substance protein A